jgi:catechol 2,3-dioxygenase-like lactoylglutathione lyase family enzyme
MTDCVPRTRPSGAVPRLDSVVLDCPDPRALATFYAALLEWPLPRASPEADQEGGAVTLDPPGGGVALGFHRAAGFVAPTWPDGPVPQQLHLDLYVDDLPAAHERAVALGARPLGDPDADAADATFVVYADPVGHPFCLCSW